MTTALGQSYTLLLIKRLELHDREAAECRTLQADLEWLGGSAHAGSRERTSAVARKAMRSVEET